MWKRRAKVIKCFYGNWFVIVPAQTQSHWEISFLRIVTEIIWMLIWRRCLQNWSSFSSRWHKNIHRSSRTGKCRSRNSNDNATIISPSSGGLFVMRAIFIVTVFSSGIFLTRKRRYGYEIKVWVQTSLE